MRPRTLDNRYPARTEEDYVSLEAVGVLLAIAIVCSAFAQGLTGYSIGGFLVNTGVGIVGALIGMWLVRAFELPQGFTVAVGGTEFPLVWATLGSAVLVAVLGALSGSRRG